MVNLEISGSLSVQFIRNQLASLILLNEPVLGIWKLAHLLIPLEPEGEDEEENATISGVKASEAHSKSS
jgi:hypothetical protein